MNEDESVQQVEDLKRSGPQASSFYGAELLKNL